MKEFSHSQIKDIYEKRIKKVVDYLNENSIGAAVFIDNESHREPAIRYFTGHSMSSDGQQRSFMKGTVTSGHPPLQPRQSRFPHPSCKQNLQTRSKCEPAAMETLIQSLSD